MRSNNFVVKFAGKKCSEVEAQANNYENNFKNSFAWLTGMKKVIFGYNNFFGLGQFMTYYTLKIDQKMTGTKKLWVPKIILFIPTHNTNKLLKFVHSCNSF